MLDGDLYDDVIAVPEGGGRSMARRLAADEGLFAGTSTGLNVAAAVTNAAERDTSDVVTTVACDTGLKHLDGDLLQGREVKQRPRSRSGGTATE